MKIAFPAVGSPPPRLAGVFEVVPGVAVTAARWPAHWLIATAAKAPASRIAPAKVSEIALVWRVARIDARCLIERLARASSARVRSRSFVLGLMHKLYRAEM